MNPTTGLCEGCLRTIDEIAHWSAMDAAQQRDVLALLHERRIKIEQAGPPKPA